MSSISVNATCPVDPDHKTFVTTAHVVQDWLVDSSGTFIEALADLETTHDPDPDNSWTCHTCHSEATVTRT